MKLKQALKWLRNALQTTKEDPSRSILYVPQRVGGMTVTAESALRFATVFACVRIIAEDIAKLPWEVLQHDQTQSKTKRLTNSPIWRMLNRRASREHGAMSVKETLIQSALLAGNGYAEIERDSVGRPIGLWPLQWDRMRPRRVDQHGDLYYEYVNPSGETSNLDPADVFHLHGPGPDGLSGYSIVSLAARSIGTGLATDEFAQAFYGNGTVVGATIEHPGQLGDEALKRIRESIDNARKGPSNAFKPFILEEGMKWNNITVPLDDAQFIESSHFRVEEICRWFRVPPHKVAHLLHATFSNIEHQSIEYVTDSLTPWITRLEQEADFKLFKNSGTIYTRVKVSDLLRGDLKTRAEYYESMQRMGVLSIDEIREQEDLDPIENGDVRLVPVNMTTLEKLVEEPEPMPEQDGDNVQPLFPQEQTAALLIKSLESKASWYEESRVHAALFTYDDRGEFVEFLDELCRRQTDYRIRSMLDILADAGADGECEPMVVGYVQDSLDAMRLEALDRFDSQARNRVSMKTIKASAETKTVAFIERMTGGEYADSHATN